MLQGRTVVVGVSGGIAAYKACELVRWLRKKGASVVVAMTDAAAEFVTPLTFQALSGNPVVRSLWGDQAPRLDVPDAARRKIGGAVEHVDLAEAADVIVLAPATADLIARLVHGEAPDALTSIVLASPKPLVVCPAMDREMWKHAATRANVSSLAARGAIIVEPEEGSLASGLEGVGRLAAIETIGAAVERAVERRASLEGMRVLVSAGRTEEPWDPVRVLTNRSSGRMGIALAEAARDRGAAVTLVLGATSVDPPEGVERVTVGTALEMERALVEAAASADLVLMAAAVSDYRPARLARDKIKRSGDALTLELVPNPDILARLGRDRKDRQVLVGFALETSNGVKRARAKLETKRADIIVLNAPGDAIGRATNRVTLVEKGGARKLPELVKREVADRILDRAAELLAERRKRAARGAAKRTPSSNRSTGRASGSGAGARRVARGSGASRSLGSASRVRSRAPGARP